MDDTTLYNYVAFVKKVYDGDTITVDIDLGLSVIMKNQKIRLYGIDTPEVRGKNKIKGFEVRDYVRGKILNQRIRIRTIKDKKGKYGRLLGKVLYSGEKSWINLNDELAGMGYAKEY